MQKIPFNKPPFVGLELDYVKQAVESGRICGDGTYNLMCHDWLEKHGEQKPQVNSALEVWKNMRLEVYQQASGNRHEPNYSDDNSKMFSLNDIDEIFEKISEQKSDNKVEPMFKIGDWVVSEITGSVYQIKNCIESLSNHKYGYILTNGDYISSYVDKHYHLWSINDAKEGDVLVHNDCTFIFMRIEKGIVKGLCPELCDSILNFGEPEYDNDYQPATKEQRDLLFQKMKEEGYEWDENKKELKKIEQKSRWSEEDDAYKLFAISAVKDYYDGENPLHKNLVDWLKSLKDRVQPQPKQEWSEKDEHRAEDTIYFLNTAKAHYASTVEIEACVDWLISLKDRVQPQSQPVWSEEDDYNVRCWIAKAEFDIANGCLGRNKELIDWLKSLKQRIGG